MNSASIRCEICCFVIPQGNKKYKSKYDRRYFWCNKCYVRHTRRNKKEKKSKRKKQHSNVGNVRPGPNRLEISQNDASNHFIRHHDVNPVVDKTFFVRNQNLSDLLRSLACPRCKQVGVLVSNRISDHGIAPGAKVQVRCYHCSFLSDYDLVDGNFIKRFASASNMAGYTYASSRKFFTFMSCNVISGPKFQDESNEHNDQMLSHERKTLDSSRKGEAFFLICKFLYPTDVQDREIYSEEFLTLSDYLLDVLPDYLLVHVYSYVTSFIFFLGTFDGSYDSRRGAHWHTNHFMSRYSDGLVLYKVMVRKVDSNNRCLDERISTHVGSSVQMEGKGYKKILTSIKYKKIELCGCTFFGYIYKTWEDGDLSAKPIFHSFFPHGMFFRCFSHKKKNIKKYKKLTKIRKASLCASCFCKGIFKCNGSLELLRDIYKQYPKHLLADHSGCTVGCDGTGKAKITDDQYPVVLEFFNACVESADEYYERFSTSKNEEIRARATVHAPKRIFFSRNYPGRHSHSSVLNNTGYGGFSSFMSNRRINNRYIQQNIQSRLQRDAENHSQRKKAPEFKLYKQQLKTRKKIRHTVNDNDESVISYKGCRSDNDVKKLDNGKRIRVFKVKETEICEFCKRVYKLNANGKIRKHKCHREGKYDE